MEHFLNKDKSRSYLGASVHLLYVCCVSFSHSVLMVAASSPNIKR